MSTDTTETSTARTGSSPNSEPTPARSSPPLPKREGEEFSDSPDSKISAIPWPLIVACLISYAALFLFTQDSDSLPQTAVALPILGVALIVSRFARFRIAHTSWTPWVLRVVGIGYVASSFQHTVGQPMLFDRGAVALLGAIWAIEATIQAWRERPWGNPPGASLILLSTLTFTAAATVGEESVQGPAGNYVLYLTPAFLLFVLLSFRALESQQYRSTPTGVYPSPPAPLPSGERGTGDRIYPHPNGKGERAAEGPVKIGVLRIDHQPDAVERRITVGRGLAVIGAIAVGCGCWLPVHLYRSQISTWGNNLLENHNVPESTGLSTAPALGDMFNADGSPTRVLRIDGYRGDPHLRGLTFETYTRGRWLPAEDSLRFAPVSLTDLGIGAHGSHATIHCYVDGLREVVAPLNVAGIVPGKDVEVERSDEDGRVLRVNAMTPYTYDYIQSNVETNQGMLCPPITAAERARCLDVPPDIEPGVWQMAQKIWSEVTARATQMHSPVMGLGADSVRTDGDAHPTIGVGEGSAAIAETKITAVTEYMMSHYSYSLTAHPGNGDKISDFLLHEHAAHCEYFASAGVMLLRILGVPSRYVTGYYAHETEGSSTVVRQRDSHAWVESWVDGVGWVTVDMTPGGGRPDKLYGNGAPMTRLWEWLADRLADAQAIAARYTPIELSAGVAGVAMAFYGLRWLLTLRRRRRVLHAKPATYETRNEALVDIARLFEVYLVKLGAPCPPNRPWVEHLEGLRIPIMSNDGGEFRPPSPQSWGNRTTATNGIAAIDKGLKVDIPLALEFVQNYNALRFRKEFDADLASGTRAMLDQLMREAN